VNGGAKLLIKKIKKARKQWGKGGFYLRSQFKDPRGGGSGRLA